MKAGHLLRPYSQISAGFSHTVYRTIAPSEWGADAGGLAGHTDAAHPGYPENRFSTLRNKPYLQIYAPLDNQ